MKLLSGCIYIQVRDLGSSGGPSSSSPSSYSHFYVESMYDDIRLHVAQSYTSSADSPFSLNEYCLFQTHKTGTIYLYRSI